MGLSGSLSLMKPQNNFSGFLFFFNMAFRMGSPLFLLIIYYLLFILLINLFFLFYYEPKCNFYQKIKFPSNPLCSISCFLLAIEVFSFLIVVNIFFLRDFLANFPNLMSPLIVDKSTITTDDTKSLC